MLKRIAQLMTKMADLIYVDKKYHTTITMDCIDVGD